MLLIGVTSTPNLQVGFFEASNTKAIHKATLRAPGFPWFHFLPGLVGLLGALVASGILG